MSNKNLQNVIENAHTDTLFNSLIKTQHQILAS
jgi:hypothetical protein